jgi:hypothetical protein
VSSRTARAIQRNPVSKKQKQKKTKKKKESTVHGILTARSTCLLMDRDIISKIRRYVSTLICNE